MPRFGDTLFGGSRFIFWCLGPLSILVGLLLVFLACGLLATGNTLAAGFALLAAVICACFFLAVSNLARFWWASRMVSASIFAAYVWYLVEVWFIHPQPLAFGGPQGRATPWNAILGLIVIGLPCLWYTILGRFSFRPHMLDEHSAGEKTNGT